MGQCIGDFDSDFEQRAPFDKRLKKEHVTQKKHVEQDGKTIDETFQVSSKAIKKYGKKARKGAKDSVLPKGYREESFELGAEFKLSYSYERTDEVELTEAKKLAEAAKARLTQLKDAVKKATDTLNEAQAKLEFAIYLAKLVPQHKGDVEALLKEAKAYVKETFEPEFPKVAKALNEQADAFVTKTFVAPLKAKIYDPIRKAVAEPVASLADLSSDADKKIATVKAFLETKLSTPFGYELNVATVMRLAGYDPKGLIDDVQNKHGELKKHLEAVQTLLKKDDLAVTKQLASAIYQETVKDQVDGLTQAAALMVKDEVEELEDQALAFANKGISDLLEGTGVSKISAQSLALMKRVSGMIGEAKGVASAVAGMVVDADKLLDDVIADPTMKNKLAFMAEIEGKANASGRGVLECNGFVEGMQALFESKAVAYVGGEVRFSNDFQLTPAFKAQVSAQLKAYAEAKGSVSALAKFSLAEGLRLSADVSAEAMAVAEASGEFSLTAFGVKVTLDGKAQARAGAKAAARGALVISPDGNFELTGAANFELGASVEVEGGVSSKFFSLRGRLKATAGLAGEIGGTFNIKRGKIVLKLNLGAALGIGGAAGLDLEIDIPGMLRSIATEVDSSIARALNSYRESNGEVPPLAKEAKGNAKKYAQNFMDADITVEFRKEPLNDGKKKLSVVFATLLPTIEKEAAGIRLTTAAALQRGLDGVLSKMKSAYGKFGPKTAWPKVEVEMAKGLAAWADYSYGDVFLVRTKTGTTQFVASHVAPVPTELVSELMDELADETKADDSEDRNVKKSDLSLWVELVNNSDAINMQSESSLTKGIERLMLEYWDKHPAYAKKDRNDEDFFAADKVGGKVNVAIEQFLGRYCGTQYAVYVTIGEKASPRVVALKHGDAMFLLQRLCTRLQGVWRTHLAPVIDPSGKVQVERSGLSESKALIDSGIPEVLRLLTMYWDQDIESEWDKYANGKGGRTSDGQKIYQRTKAVLEQMNVSLSPAFVKKTDLPGVRNNISAGLTEYAKALTKHHDSMAAARKELNTLATELKKLLDQKGDVKKRAANLVAMNKYAVALKKYRNTDFEAAIRADVEKGEATSRALNYVCGSLLERCEEEYLQVEGAHSLGDKAKEFASLAKRIRSRAQSWSDEEKKDIFAHLKSLGKEVGTLGDLKDSDMPRAAFSELAGFLGKSVGDLL